MRFLIDECLHTSLARVAHDAGHSCDHVSFLGLSGRKDRQLMARIRSDEYTFVTNNRTDFTNLYADEELHPGLIIIVPNVTPARQRELFEAALTHIGTQNLINAVVEVSFADGAATCSEYSYPPS
jgi:predicted nuclease of predicted toxin-antitoxin system